VPDRQLGIRGSLPCADRARAAQSGRAIAGYCVAGGAPSKNTRRRWRSATRVGGRVGPAVFGWAGLRAALVHGPQFFRWTLIPSARMVEDSAQENTAQPRTVSEGACHGDDRKRGPLNWLVLLVLPVMVGLGWHFAPLSRTAQDALPEKIATKGTVVERPLEPRDMAALAAYVSATWKGESEIEHSLARLEEPAQAVYVAFRSQGSRRYQTWSFEGNVAEALAAALKKGREALGATEAAIDSFEINLAHTFRDYSLEVESDRRRIFSNVHRGVRGLEVRLGDKRKIQSPTQSLAQNRKVERQLEIMAKDWRVDKDAMMKAEIRTFEADQILVSLGEEPSARLMDRGNNYVAIEDVTSDSTTQLVDLQAQWLMNNVHKDGRMTYLYWPSQGREAPPSKNNMIRQWMATVALGRLADDRDDPKIWEAAEQNIDYNLEHFYHREGAFGLIELRERVKLGALALAVYSIVNHPKREKWSGQETAMRRTIDSLWHENGEFTTFFKKPEGVRPQPNFYPGEALFLWADLYEKERDPELLRRFMLSFDFYREWHMQPHVRNPAFVPWHTQAYYQVWKITKDDRLKDFVFTMNDWLLGVQQWDGLTYDDTRGRFYAPDRPFGPPHASATGVYMEGLIDAYRLAVATADTKRSEAYRIALVRGLRSIMQIQYVDEVDTFYVKHKKYVVGGLRTTVYDNSIRCDNIQHSMMANIRILQSFDDDDYSHPAAP